MIFNKSYIKAPLTQSLPEPDDDDGDDDVDNNKYNNNIASILRD